MAAAGISSPQFESHPALDPRTGDLYFVRSSPQFRGWRILVGRCAAGGWAAPVPAPFSGEGVEADPYFTADGSRVWFISTRARPARQDRRRSRHLVCRARRTTSLERTRQDARAGQFAGLGMVSPARRRRRPLFRIGPAGRLRRDRYLSRRARRRELARRQYGRRGQHRRERLRVRAVAGRPLGPCLCPTDCSIASSALAKAGARGSPSKRARPASMSGRLSPLRGAPSSSRAAAIQLFRARSPADRRRGRSLAGLYAMNETIGESGHVA